MVRLEDGKKKKEDGEPGRVTSNKRKNRKSCPLAQMLPSGEEEDKWQAS